MPTLVQQLLLALRSLRRAPAFTLTVIATLAIGIGLNAAIFTVVDNVLIRPLGYHDADRIVAIQTHFDRESRSIPRLAALDYEDMRRQVHGLESVAYYDNGPDGLSLNGASLYTEIANTSPRFMQVMGVEPLAGRLFNPADQEGADALVSAAFARDHLGALPSNALGQKITYAGTIYTVAGVLPDGFNFPGRTAVWIEAPSIQTNASRSSYNTHVVARRRSSVSPAQLTAEFAQLTANLKRAYEEDSHKSLEALPLQEQLTGRLRPTLNLLMGSVAVILLIVCANITHLQLVRATRSLRATSIRTALGATRRSLAAHALLETFLLAIAGSAAALLLAVPALRFLVRIAPPSTPRLADIHLNRDVVLFSFAIAFAAMVVTALLPVWRSWHIDPAQALRSDSSRGTESRASLRLRGAFIVAEVALTLTLSVAAILLTRQLIAQSRQDLGFLPGALLTVDIHAIPSPQPHTTSSKAEEAAATAALNATNLARLDSLLDTARAVPGVTSAAAIAGAPMGFGGSDASFAIKGRSDFTPNVNLDDLPEADMRPVTPGILATLGVPLLRGRAFAATDRTGAPDVVLINQQLARASFPDQDPLGQQLKFGYDFAVPHWATVVGVVGDIRSASPALPARPTVYMSLAQHSREAGDLQLVIRADPARTTTAALAETLHAALLRTHPEVAAVATTMSANLTQLQQSGSFRTTLFTLFAAVSILLAAIGTYGVTAYTVAQRRFEFGLRIALGANRVQLLALVLRSALSVALLGVALGTALSLSLQRVLGSIVGQLPAFDLAAYASAALAVLGIAILATLIPASRAAHIDPNTVLRSE